MKLMLIDFETQAMLSISNPAYTYDDGTIAMCMSWGLEGCGDPALWWGKIPGIVKTEDAFPEAIDKHLKAGGMPAASNAPFDQAIWNNVCVEDYGWPYVPPEKWYCTQAQARVAGLPSSLDNSARALGLVTRKDRKGKELIKKCCIPPFSTNVKDYADIGAYCLQDWVVMDAVVRKIPHLTTLALEDYHFNQRLNERGIRIDRALAVAATEYADAERAEINVKLQDVTCNAMDRCTQHARFKSWLYDCFTDDGQDEGIKLMTRYVTDKITKETVIKYSSDKTVRANLLAADTDGALVLEPDVREALELMDDAGGSATSKFAKMAQRADKHDDRVRGVMRYAGAPSTLRFSSMDLQVHNFRRDAFNAEDAAFYKAQMLAGETLKDRDGKPVRVMDTLGRLLRSAIVPKEGHVFIVNDWSAIEARMTAYLAKDKDTLNVFRNGEDVYCHDASAFYRRTITKEDTAERQVGKVMNLALGFLGGPGALGSMASTFRVHIPEEDRTDMVKAWRASHPKIVALGARLIASAQRAMVNPNTWEGAGPAKYLFNEHDGALYCLLPDGETTLRYPDARISLEPAPWDETTTIPQITALKAAFIPAADAKEWPRHALWRGLLLENLVQATCAIMLRDACVVLEDEGYDVAFHVHDEIILEVPFDQAEAAAAASQAAMEFAPVWAPKIPLVAKPVIMTRWGK